jgi:SpoVK/Ycf46/Vps4 family AAA+-type ATPase
MARADLLVNLVRAGSAGDQSMFRSTVEAIAAEERAKHHNQLAAALEANLRRTEPNVRSAEVPRVHDGGHGGLLFEIQAQRSLNSVVLDPHVRESIHELIEEQQRRDLLRSYGVEPRHRILLAGPPGNGKTSVAEALACDLMLPLFVVRYEAVIGSYLGETSGRLKRLFDFVRTHECVLFFDEFDTLGKERGDVHETGEIKRVVSSLLLQIDALPSHVVVVTATNHPELLDRAVWRRFELRLNLPGPTLEQAAAWFKQLEERLGQPLGLSARTLASRIKAISFSELEDFASDLHRRYILGLPDSTLPKLVRTRLESWKNRLNPER